jgi:hypothetical protein
VSEIELIEETKQLATRGPGSMHAAVGAGEFRRKFLLLENEDFEFGYGVHLVSYLSSHAALFRRTADVTNAAKAR